MTLGSPKFIAIMMLTLDVSRCPIPMLMLHPPIFMAMHLGIDIDMMMLGVGGRGFADVVCRIGGKDEYNRACDIVCAHVYIYIYIYIVG